MSAFVEIGTLIFVISQVIFSIEMSTILPPARAATISSAVSPAGRIKRTSTSSFAKSGTTDKISGIVLADAIGTYKNDNNAAIKTKIIIRLVIVPSPCCFICKALLILYYIRQNFAITKYGISRKIKKKDLILFIYND
jgi:hypothetical protein